MLEQTELCTLDSFTEKNLKGKTIFIRVDFNVPMFAARQGHYRVADDSRIRRFLDLTFRKIHDLTQGDCRIIIGSHLGRPHIKKDHSGWDGIFNIQFVSSHFDTLIRKRYGDIYTIFPPESIDSQLKHSLEMIREHQLPVGGIKFLPNLRYLLDPENPEIYRKEFIEILGAVSDVFINCAFGANHRLTKSIQLLPEIMRNQNKPILAGSLLNEEIKRLGQFAHQMLTQPEKTLVFTGGAKISDKIEILKQFVHSKIGKIFLGGKMVNAFLVAKYLMKKGEIPTKIIIPEKLHSTSESDNQNFVNEVKLASEILNLANEKNVSIAFPDDYKVVKEYQQTTYITKEIPDMDQELQLDLGFNTIKSFHRILSEGHFQNIFWNGPLGAYDHPFCNNYAEGSMELAKLLFGASLLDPNLSVVIGGGDTAAILNKFNVDELKSLMKNQIQNQLPVPINLDLIKIDFIADDAYTLFNYFASNFFVSTGGGSSLEFLEGFLKNQGKSPLASYLPGTAILLTKASTDSQVA